MTLMDPRALSQGELTTIANRYDIGKPLEVCERDVLRLLQYIDLLHELVMPITGLFLQREQEKMGWKQAGLPTEGEGK